MHPPIGPRGLICKNEFLGGGLFELRAYQGGLFPSLAFSSEADRKMTYFCNINKQKSHKKAILQAKINSQ